MSIFKIGREIFNKNLSALQDDRIIVPLESGCLVMIGMDLILNIL